MNQMLAVFVAKAAYHLSPSSWHCDYWGVLMFRLACIFSSRFSFLLDFLEYLLDRCVKLQLVLQEMVGNVVCLTFDLCSVVVV